MGIRIERSIRRASVRIAQRRSIAQDIAKAINRKTSHAQAYSPSIHDSDHDARHEMERVQPIKEDGALNTEGEQILQAIANDLELRVSIHNHTNRNDPFSVGRVPSHSICMYLGRLIRYLNMWRGHAGGSESSGIRAAVITLIYLDKLEENGFVVNRENVHRLIMVGLLVATKFTEDDLLLNTFWARVGGVPASEVNALERTFCNLLKFELFVHEKHYVSALDSLLQ